MVLRPWSQVIAAYLALGLGGRAPSTKGTYRSVLRHLAEVDAPKAAPRFAGSLAPSPYGAGERAELYSIASSQRRPWRVHSALVLLAFGLGAGLCGGGHRRPTLAPKGGHQAPLLRALGPLAPRAGSRGPGHHQDVPARPPKVCTQSAVTIAPDIGARHRQDLAFGSPEWGRTCTTYRNTIEGTNGYVKDTAHEALGQPGRRRVRGTAAQSLFVGLLLMAANFRKIAAFRDLAAAGDGPKVVARARRRRISITKYRPPPPSAI